MCGPVWEWRDGTLRVLKIIVRRETGTLRRLNLDPTATVANDLP